MQWVAQLQLQGVVLMVQKMIAAPIKTGNAIEMARREQRFQAAFQVADRDACFAKADEQPAINISVQYQFPRRKTIEGHPLGQTDSICADESRIGIHIDREKHQRVVFGATRLPFWGMVKLFLPLPYLSSEGSRQKECLRISCQISPRDLRWRLANRSFHETFHFVEEYLLPATEFRWSPV
jgi:hypothetical protein